MMSMKRKINETQGLCHEKFTVVYKKQKMSLLGIKRKNDEDHYIHSQKKTRIIENNFQIKVYVSASN